jgi:O-antigen/teichoic acid export membrane protein
VLIFQVGAGLLNLALDCLLIPLWGGLGACVATGSAYVSLGIAQTLAAHRFFGVHPPMAFQARLLLASATALGVSLLWPGAGQGWAGLAIRGGCYGLSLMGLLYALKPVDACDVESARRVNPLIYQLARLFGRASPAPS